MDDIVRLADVAKGTFYYHFRSKEELVVRMARRRLSDAIAMMQRRLQDGESPLTCLRAFLHEVAEVVERDRELSRVFFSLSLQEPPRESGDPPQPSFRRAASEGVAAAQAAGQIRADLSAGELGEMLGSLFLSAELSWLMHDAHDSLVDRADRAFTFFLEGALPR